MHNSCYFFNQYFLLNCFQSHFIHARTTRQFDFSCERPPHTSHPGPSLVLERVSHCVNSQLYKQGVFPRQVAHFLKRRGAAAINKIKDALVCFPQYTAIVKTCPSYSAIHPVEQHDHDSFVMNLNQHLLVVVGREAACTPASLWCPKKVNTMKCNPGNSHRDFSPINGDPPTPPL